MKRLLAWVLLGLMLLQTICVHADGTTSIGGKAYDLEVRSVYVYTTLDGMHRVLRTEQTTDVQKEVRRIVLEYDFEAQTKECIGRFEEDAPAALVIVDGFDARLAALAADEVVLTVNGQQVITDAQADVSGMVGWEDVYRTGSRSAVFPIVLTRQGGVYDITVRVQGMCDGERIVETAQIQVELINTRKYKPEKTARIVDVKCDEADVYILGDRLYVDHPAGKSGSVKIRLCFADENGSRFENIVWAKGTICGKKDAQAALYLEKDARLEEDGAVQYRLADDAEAKQYEQMRFVLETKDALYTTQGYTLVERFGVTKEDPKGICFEEAQKMLRVGEVYEPTVLGVKTGERLHSDVFGTLTLYAGADTDAQVIDVSDGKTVIAVRPGSAYVTARYESAGRVWDAAAMKIVVTENRVREYTVLCRTLNVRAGADLAARKVGRLHRGDSVQVVCIQNGWARLADGRYVCAQYIE